MRVTASPSQAPAVTDRAAAPDGEPFRAALRAVSEDPARPDDPAAPDGAAQVDPSRQPVQLEDQGDDTMAPAAAQAAYLAAAQDKPPRLARGLPLGPGVNGAMLDEIAGAPSGEAAPPGAAGGRPARLARWSAADAANDAAALATAALAGHQTLHAAAPAAMDATSMLLGQAGADTAAPTAPAIAAPDATAALLDQPRRAAAAAADRPTSPPHLPEAGLDPMLAATLRAAYGLAIAGAPAPAAASQTAAPGAMPVPADPSAADRATAPSPGGELHAAIAASATASTASAASATRPGEARATAAASAAASTALRATGLDTTALTPLEQAVHELVGRIAATERGAAHNRATRPADADAPTLPALTGLPAAPSASAAASDPPASSAAAPDHSRAAAPIQLPESSNPSHVHLVIDDGPERVVATVAVRGNEVHVSLRATDDATAAALARNAASLDHAMHGRGLALGDLSAERKPRERRQLSQDDEPRERRPSDAERFELEEKP